jgi:hypothetical protein
MAHRCSSTLLTWLLGRGSWSLPCPVLAVGEVGQAPPRSGVAEGEPDGVGGIGAVACGCRSDQVAARWNRAVEFGLLPRAGEPQQQVGGPLGKGVREGVVPGEGADQVPDRLLAVVEEKSRTVWWSRQWPNPCT